MVLLDFNLNIDFVKYCPPSLVSRAVVRLVLDGYILRQDCLPEWFLVVVGCVVNITV